MAKTMPETLQLSFFGFEFFKKPVSQVRPEIAAWGFKQMYKKAGDAFDWSKVPFIEGNGQREPLPTSSKNTVPDNDPSRNSSHLSCRGPYRFRR